MTKSGSVLGTPAYMSPEQARDPNVDGRADLFSLGVLMYQMATGTLPFKGHDMLSFLASVSFDTPTPPCKRNPEIPAELNDLIRHLLEKDPAARVQSAEQVVARLAQCTPRQKSEPEALAPDSHGKSARLRQLSVAHASGSDSSPRRRVWPIVLIALAFLGGAGYLVPQIILRIQNKDGTETKIELPKDAKLIVENKGKQVFPPPEPKWDDEMHPDEKLFDSDMPAEAAQERDDELPDWNFAKEAPPPAIVPFDAKQAVKHQEDWAEFLNVPVEVENKLGMKFRLIPPGEFETTDAQGKPHKVRVTKPYYIGATEVTVAQFRKFVDATKYITEAERTGMGQEPWTWKEKAGITWRTPGYELADSFPVSQVGIADAAAFCDWLMTQDKRLHRLPKSSEWEFAARGGGNGPMGWEKQKGTRLISDMTDSK